MTEREQFIALVSNEPLQKADAIIVLEGDGLYRLPHAVKLYKEGWAPVVVFSGGITNKAYGSFPKEDAIPELKKLGVKDEDLIFEDKSQHTRDQAVFITKLADERGWKKIILVASHYHQYRAFLTFLKARAEQESKVEIINSPARDLAWFQDTPWGARLDLLQSEFKKIETYSQSGHLASFAEAIAYQKEKELDLGKK